MVKKDYLECLTKKGISPLIATVLLIGFTIAIAAIVFKWGGGYTKDLSQQTSYKLASGIQCTKSVNIIIEDSCILGNKIKVRVTNKANGNLKGFILRTKNSLGVINQTDIILDTGPYQTTNIEGYYTGLPKDFMSGEVAVIPKIDVSGNPEICPGNTGKFNSGLCQNLVKYGSFEGVRVFLNQNSPGLNDPQDIWYSIPINIAQVQDNIELFGSKALEITGSGIVYQAITLVQGKLYTISGWINSQTSSDGFISVSASNTCNPAFYDSTPVISTNGQWSYINKTFTAPCNSIGVISLQANNPLNGYVKFDVIQFYES